MLGSDLDCRNVNSLWAGILAETLARSGVRRAVVAPGSRSAPLAFAFARHAGIEAIPVLDERSAGFFALGLAKAGRQPVAVVCTSGTAAGNLLPAVIEARESAVPLVVLTADRPPELRDCASGQAVDQQKLYGGYPAFYHELALPEAREPLLRYLRQTVAHACARASRPGGPVHLNVPFRDPLPPLADKVAEPFAASVDWEGFFASVAPSEAPRLSAADPGLSPSVHGLLVAGPAEPADPAAYAAAAGEIARRLGWPILADALSPLRHHSSTVPHLVTAYDAILRDPAAAESLRPETVVCLGGWPTGKVLRQWLEAAGAPVLLVTERADNRDGLHGRTRIWPAPPEALAALLPEEPAGPNGYQELWSGHERRARAALDGRLAAEQGLFEPKAAWLLARHLPEDTPVFVASSMPVRDVEFVWPPGDRRAQVFFNRGANGIDGTLSTALGVAHASGRPAVLLTGDLALLHDANGFLIGPKFRGGLTVVLINNRGGGIFEHLPVARFDPPFEEFFATPQRMDFRALCAAHGVAHEEVRDWEHFTGLISELPFEGIRVLELRTDRKQDAAGRARLFADVLRPA